MCVIMNGSVTKKRIDEGVRVMNMRKIFNWVCIGIGGAIIAHNLMTGPDFKIIILGCCGIYPMISYYNR